MVTLSFNHAAHHQFSDFDLFILDKIKVFAFLSVDLFISTSLHQKVSLCNADFLISLFVLAASYFLPKARR